MVVLFSLFTLLRITLFGLVTYSTRQGVVGLVISRERYLLLYTVANASEPSDGGRDDLLSIHLFFPVLSMIH
jgi:hypothetical protein